MSQPATEPTPAQRRAVVRCPVCGTANRIDLSRLPQGPKCANCHRPILLDRPIKSTEADFDQSVQGTTVPVVVDFYADWCGPCHMMAPTLDEFASRHAGSVLVLKVDTEVNPKVAGRFGIRGIPTLIVFENGNERGRHVGVADLKTLETLTGQPSA
jgi:thioredoxin 2